MPVDATKKILQATIRHIHSSIRLLLFSAGSASVEIPTTRRVYETVLNGLEKIGANYPISE